MEILPSVPILRIRFANVSPMKTFPAGSARTPSGKFSDALAAGPASPADRYKPVSGVGFTFPFPIRPPPPVPAFLTSADQHVVDPVRREARRGGEAIGSLGCRAAVSGKT